MSPISRIGRLAIGFAVSALAAVSLVAQTPRPSPNPPPIPTGGGTDATGIADWDPNKPGQRSGETTTVTDGVAVEKRCENNRVIYYTYPLRRLSDGKLVKDAQNRRAYPTNEPCGPNATGAASGGSGNAQQSGGSAPPIDPTKWPPVLRDAWYHVRWVCINGYWEYVTDKYFPNGTRERQIHPMPPPKQPCPPEMSEAATGTGAVGRGPLRADTSKPPTITVEPGAPGVGSTGGLQVDPTRPVPLGNAPSRSGVGVSPGTTPNVVAPNAPGGAIPQQSSNSTRTRTGSGGGGAESVWMGDAVGMVYDDPPKTAMAIGSNVDLSNTATGFGSNTVVRAPKDPRTQVMILLLLAILVPGIPAPAGDELDITTPQIGLLTRGGAALRNLFHRPQPIALHQSPRSRTLPRGVHTALVARLSRTEASAAQAEPKGRAYLTSLGVSTGEAFQVQLVNDGTEPINFSGDGVVVEAIASAASNAVRQEIAKAVSSVASRADGYCLEFLRQPPTAGQLFRIAGNELQKRYEPMRRILRAGQKLQDLGLLNPDSDPKAYFHSIRQWSLWTREQDFNVRSFTNAFVEHTRKNLVAAGQRWTGQFEDILRAAAPTRWKDIQAVLSEAAKPSAPGVNDAVGQ